MLNTCAPPGTKASVMALMTVFNNLGGLVIIQVLGKIFSHASNLKQFDNIMLSSVVPCAIIAAILFFLSGFNYSIIF